MAEVFEGRRTFLSRALRPVERGVYRLAGVDETVEQNWLEYTLSMILFTTEVLAKRRARPGFSIFLWSFNGREPLAAGFRYG